ncbi:MAG: glycosyltransferase family 2 protein [Bacteroidales bacterium]|nr:glycosyltransferase family 2 protein [Bacteroidales bacterium]
MSEKLLNTALKFKNLKICVLIPTYRNAQFLPKVLDSVLSVVDDVIVVNDGSPDDTETILQAYSGRIIIERHKTNQGKGIALKTGFKKAAELGFKYAVTMDSDLQHRALDLNKFVDAIIQTPNALIVGARTLSDKQLTQGSGFANKFSNFWFTVHTLKKLPDTQTGFRIYPLKEVVGMKLFSSKYETELEMLVRCAWKGVEIKSIPINVYYPNREERVSSFRPARDFTRISILNTFFTFAAFFYGYPSMLLHWIIKKFRR